MEPAADAADKQGENISGKSRRSRPGRTRGGRPGDGGMKWFHIAEAFLRWPCWRRRISGKGIVCKQAGFIRCVGFAVSGFFRGVYPGRAARKDISRRGIAASGMAYGRGYRIWRWDDGSGAGPVDRGMVCRLCGRDRNYAGGNLWGDLPAPEQEGADSLRAVSVVGDGGDVILCVGNGRGILRWRRR